DASGARHLVGDARRVRAHRGAARSGRRHPERLQLLPDRHDLRRDHLHRHSCAGHGFHPADRRGAPRVLAGADRDVNGAQPRIRFDRVSVSFSTASGMLKVVDDVSYTIANGEFVSIIGPSGCGKTTMMNLVAGFVKPSSGTVALDGNPISGPGPERGVIFQDYGVFPWLTVEQNIAFGLKLRINRAAEDERRSVCRRYMEL